MGSYKIRRLCFSQNIIEILEKHNFNSCKDLLSFPKLELQALLGISCSKAEQIFVEVAKKCVSEPKTAYELLLDQESTENKGFLSLSLDSLDLLLQGGLPLGKIAEFAGPPGVGKTQFCFMLSILTALPFSEKGLGSNVIYIDTESAFSAERLKIMAQKRFPSVFKNNTNLAELLKKILVYKASSISDLKEIILTLEKEIIKNKVKTVIVDSVASLFRKECGTETMLSYMERNKLLLEQAAKLKDLALTYNIIVLVTNQITSHISELDSVALDKIDEDKDCTNLNTFTGFSTPAVQKKVKQQGVNSDHVIPALGNTWFHCVNTRLVAQFLNSSVRQMTIAKSPIAPNASVNYVISDEGITLTDEDISFISLSDPLNKTIQTKYNFLTPDMTGTGTVFTASMSKGS